MLIVEYVSLFLVTIILTTDNFRVSISIGLSSEMKKYCRKWIAFSFSIFESATTYVGLVVGAFIVSIFVIELTKYLIPALIVGYGAVL